MKRSETHPTSKSELLAIECRLDWLIQLADLERADPGRRLNAVENLTAEMLARLTGRRRRIHPRTDVHLSPFTYVALMRWVEQRVPAEGVARTRLLT
jgi:hypothetical protein